MIRRVRSALVCDDIRQEDNGKQLLIGVYGREISVTQRPAMVNLQLQMTFDVDAEEIDVELRIKAVTQKSRPLKLKASGGYCTLTLAVTIALTEKTVLRADIRNLGADWLECGEWEIDFADEADAAPEPLAEHILRMKEHMLAESSEIN